MSRCMDPTKDRYIPASYVSLPEGRFASSWLKKEFTMIESTKNHPTIFSPNKTAFYRLLKGGGVHNFLITALPPEMSRL